MTNSHGGDLLPPPYASNDGVIRAERVWRHRYDLDLTASRPRSNRAWLSTGAIAGLAAACVVLYGLQGSLQDLPSKGKPPEEPAIGKLLQEDRSVIQRNVDASSAFGNVVESDIPPPTAVVVPIRRPVHQPLVARKAEGANAALTMLPAGVVRFDRCNPECETRDPLVIGSQPTEFTPKDVALNMRTDEHGSNLSALRGAGYVLDRAAALPFTALKMGRDVIGKIAGLE